MQNTRPSLFRRNDTFFGVCEALGEDFGFNPLLLRIAFGVLLLWNPTIVIGTYLSIGVFILLSRWIFPRPRLGNADQPAADRQDTLALAA